MEFFPNDVLGEIFIRVTARNNLALVCRKWYEVERVLRRVLRTGCGLNPPESALAALSARFSNLSTVDISFSGWVCDMGRQVDDMSLKILSQGCTALSDLTLNFCTFITDVGMANLTFCRDLKAVRLNFLPCVTERGLLSLVSGCRSLTLLHINRLMNVKVLQWLQFLGNNRRIESLSIRNCKGVGEAELERLGIRGWQNLREFFYEVDVIHRPTGDFFGHNGRGANLLEGWKVVGAEPQCCPDLQVFSLTNCLSMSGTGLAWLLSQCGSLRQLHLDTCVGLRDEDLTLFAQNCSQVRSIFLRVPFHLPAKVTDVSLRAVAQHCHSLDTLMLSFGDDDFFPSFTESGVVAIVEGCTKLRVLSLDRAYFVTDSTMMVVSQSESLEVLELNKCQGLTDAGMEMVGRSNLKKLTVSKCFGLTDAWLTPLKIWKRLAYLSVQGCPQISHESVKDAAQLVFYDCNHARNLPE